MWILLAMGSMFLLFGYWNWKHPEDAWKANVARFNHYGKEPTAKDVRRQKVLGIVIMISGIAFLLVAGWAAIQMYILR